MKRVSGQALLLIVGVLALLALLGTSFALNMLLARREAANFLNSAKAKYIAEGGINRALVDIRNNVTTSSYNNLTTYINGYVTASGTDVPLGQGTYTIAFSTSGSSVLSEAEKVNINSFDERDYSQISILRGFLTYTQIANIIDYRDADNNNTVLKDASNTVLGTGNIEGTANCKNLLFVTIDEVKLATGISDAIFRANSQYLTINKPIIRGGLVGRYYSNLNGVSPNVSIDTDSYKGEIVELGHLEEHYLEGTDGDVWDQDSGWTESHDAEFAGGYLVSTTADFGIENFGAIWDGYIEILPSEVGSLINFWVMVDDGVKFFINEQNILPAGAWQDQGATAYGGTYTFQRPGWHKIRIEYYDGAAANTLRVKWGGTDFNTGTVIPAERFGYEAPTEMLALQVYNSAGNYNITCTAKVTQGIQVLAQKSVSAVMRVFGTWTQTTKSEWFAAWFNDYAAGIPAGYVNPDGNLPAAGGDDYRDGEMRNVTWLDSCPLDASQDLEGGGFGTMVDSLKLGFWANFEDDPTSSVLFFKGLVKSDKWGPNAWSIVTKDDGAHNFFWISWGDIWDQWPVGAPDGHTELCVETGVHTSIRFEVNPFYYFPSGNNPATVSGQPNVFMRSWTATDQPPGVESKAYWKGNGTEYTGGYDFWGNPNGAGVWAGVPVVGGVEQDDAPYTGDPLTGYGYDADGDGLYDMDALTGVNERLCKVWPTGSHAVANRKWIYNSTKYDCELDPPAAYAYWQPDVPFTTAMMYCAGERMDSVSGGSGMGGARGFGILTKDNDSYWDPSLAKMMGWTYPEDNDMIELTLDSVTGSSPPYGNRVAWCGIDFRANPALVMIGLNGIYSGWERHPTYNKQVPQPNAGNGWINYVAATTTVSVPNFQFLSRNAYDANDPWNSGDGWPKFMSSAVYVGFWWMGRTGGNADQDPPLNNGDDRSMTTFWDNIRIIPESGFLVSTPCIARSSTEPDVKWGTISWTGVTSANTSITMYLRTTGTALPTTDTFASTYANGAQVAGTGRVAQYKVVLRSTDFNPTTSNWNLVGGKTPRMDDITITYVPSVAVYYWR